MSNTLTYLRDKYGLDLSGPVVEIEGVGRLDIIRWCRELDFKLGAEIGVYLGEFSRLILRSNPQMKLYGVDPWAESPDYNELGAVEFDGLYQSAVDHCRREIKSGRYEIIRKTSMDALEDIPDNSLDFVYIDANHQAPYVYQDISGWTGKVRIGGLVSGHDYIRVKKIKYAIKDALETFMGETDNGPLFILGSNEEKPGVVRDTVRSWAFVRRV